MQSRLFPNGHVSIVSWVPGCDRKIVPKTASALVNPPNLELQVSECLLAVPVANWFGQMFCSRNQDRSLSEEDTSGLGGVPCEL